MNTITLVSCVSKKLDRPAPAAELYVSPWFKKARRYAELTSDRWFILSAKYGLVEPDRVIEPYERTLNEMNWHGRIEWAGQVYFSLQEALSGLEGKIVFLAGHHYRDYLARWLEGRFVVEVPLAELGIGQQLAWFEARLKVLTAPIVMPAQDK
jgi:hypothetical protein